MKSNPLVCLNLKQLDNSIKVNDCAFTSSFSLFSDEELYIILFQVTVRGDESRFSNRLMYRRVRELPASQTRVLTMTSSSYSTIATSSLLFFLSIHYSAFERFKASEVCFSLSLSLHLRRTAIMRTKLTLLEKKKNHRLFYVDHYGTLVSLSVHTLHAKNSLTLLLIVGQ